ncbi:hypothetical protein [Nannocystis bainbridge]|uniref:Uncharacterized protein n=1 Tax=Nannocystis bainbridge TaxID=2995303 RepID=A0ABT5E4X2_9BACT|nr:hypothetical protein [Nannocystis bainbridge]MDC0720891.1 hypothetical protein [Nannocystis bainbridge]
MKWGLQHVKVTLEESESGETVVIQQSSDGRVTCERGKQSKSESAANHAPRAARTKTEASTSVPAKPVAEKRREGEARAAEDKPKARAAAKKPRVSQPASPPSGGRRTSLEWMPVKDHKYDGFAAPSGAGHFKALIAEGTQWALFFEIKGIVVKPIACFGKVSEAKKRAQKLHDAGWPESEFGPLTAGLIARACPAPAGRADEGTQRGEERKAAPETEENPAPPRVAPKAKEKPAVSKTKEKPAAQGPEEKPAAPEPEPRGPSKSEAAQDQELMSGFTSEIEKALDEDEDEDD